jgi:hypothetical protein
MLSFPIIFEIASPDHTKFLSGRGARTSSC